MQNQIQLAQWARRTTAAQCRKAADNCLGEARSLKSRAGDAAGPTKQNRTTASNASMLMAMALQFPNESRSFDARRLCVRFWAYDESLEIPFFVEADALSRIDPQATRDEKGLLEVFDRHRNRILKAADRVYVRNRRGSYSLAAADLG